MRKIAFRGKTENKKKEDESFEVNIEGVETGICAYLEWKDAGKPTDGKGRNKPSPNLKQEKVIVRPSMPIIDPTKRYRIIVQCTILSIGLRVWETGRRRWRTWIVMLQRKG